MKLNPCSNCQGTPDEDQELDQNLGDYLPVVYCPKCNKCTGSCKTAKAARIAWNAANPVNDAQNGQHEALEALQQAVAVVLMSNRDYIRRYKNLPPTELALIDLLINQGVLVETDGRITLK